MYDRSIFDINPCSKYRVAKIMTEIIRELSRSTLFNISDLTLVNYDQLAPMNEPPPVQLIDTVVDNKYRILTQIGAGGMGSVFLAHHIMLNKEVALKTFKSSNFTEEERLRFQREAQAIAKLNHPNIIQVFDFGYINQQIPYYTMDYLAGESLGDLLQISGSLSLDQTLSIFVQACRGMSAAHKKGIIHRDLKPDNIFLETNRKSASAHV